MIDDDAGVRWVLQELFAVEDISCMPAENGRKGSAGFRIQAVTGHCGYQAGRHEQASVARCIYRECNQIKILFITGYSETIEGKVDGDLPVIGILEKPFNITEVLQQVKVCSNR